MRIRTRAVIVTLCLLNLIATSVRADNWPTHRHDNRRSGVTRERLRLPLREAWRYACPERPQTAWSGPAKWDSYAKISKLKSMRNFDPVFYTVVARSCVFFGSSVDDAVHCLDLHTGAERWAYFTNGPVRVSPSFHNGKLYFGSDDGCVYCVGSDDGQLIWRYNIAPDADKIPFNGKIISSLPCRTGVLVQDRKAYCAASLLPWDKTYVCALDAQSGSIEGAGLYRSGHEHMTAQGPIIASRSRLYISQGRQTPLVFDCADGHLLKDLGHSGFGGVFGLLTEDSMLVHGYGQNHRGDGELRFFGGQKKDLLVTFPRATSIVIHAGIVYLHADGQLQAFHRDRYVTMNRRIEHLRERQKQLQKKMKELPASAADAEHRRLDDDLRSTRAEIAELQQKLPSCFLWRAPSDCPLALIGAGDTLFAGGLDTVTAHEMATGRQLWTASVRGRAYGLAVAQGALLVSTDLGHISCFTPAADQQ